MRKKLLSLFLLTLCAVFLFGCGSKSAVKNDSDDKKKAATQEEAGKSDDKKQGKKLDAEKIVTANFGKEDKQFDFRVKVTKDFLNKYNKINSLLDSKYTQIGGEPEGFSKVREQSQLEYSKRIEDYDKQYQYIKELKYGLYFNDDKSQITFQTFNLVLCDDDKDGKIELNDATKTMLKTVYPEINLEEVQKKIAEAAEAEKAKDYKSIKLESVDKYHNVTFRWFRYKDDTPLEITIEIETYEDYPRS